MIQKACALSGHRDLPEDFSKSSLTYALADLIDEGYTYFLCGMARGFDLTALRCLAELKREKNIFLEACIPYAEQELAFLPAEKEEYYDLLGFCDKKTVLFPSYRKGCLLVRNRYMVDRCDLLFAFCEKGTGGTAYTVKYAEKKGIEIRFYE